jgi:isopentenyl-diphosphate delta-isomerase
MTATEQVEVVLVDEAGRLQGTAPRRDAHQAPGLLHAAVSVVVVNRDRQVLVQQRADVKELFGSFWSNSCCTHPHPGEEFRAAAERRVREELGMRTHEAQLAGSFVYWARDPRSTLVEYERDTVVIVRSDDVPNPEPAEVSAWRWMRPDELVGGRTFTPWSAYVHALSAPQTIVMDAGTLGGGG